MVKKGRKEATAIPSLPQQSQAAAVEPKVKGKESVSQSEKKPVELDSINVKINVIVSLFCSQYLNYLVGSIYSPKKIVDSIASMIVVSTIISFITIPIVVFFALKYFV